MAMGLLYMLALFSNVCLLYGPWIQWLFVAATTLKNSRYRMNIFSNVGHPRSDLVMLLVLCMVACNGWGADIVLQVPQDSTNHAKKG
jgi:hypothetical protein